MSNRKLIYVFVFSIELLFSVACMLLVYKYYDFKEIPEQLLVDVGVNLGEFITIFLIELMLLIFFVLQLFFLIKVIKYGSDSKQYKSFNRGLIVFPIVFFLITPFLLVIPTLSTPFTQLSDQNIVICSTFDDLQKSGFEIAKYSVCEKNVLGKAGYYEQNTFFNNIDELDEEQFVNKEIYGDARFLCSYQSSNYDFFTNKFERYERENYILKNQEIKEEYILYYEQDNDQTKYRLLIENGEEYYIAKFDSFDNDFFNNYTKETFVKDSLSIYNECKAY